MLKVILKSYQFDRKVVPKCFRFSLVLRHTSLPTTSTLSTTPFTRWQRTRLATDVRSKASLTDTLSKIPTKESKLRFALFFLLLKRAVETPSTVAGGPPPSKMEAKDTVHEMAKDEARHGKAFAGLLERYFK